MKIRYTKHAEKEKFATLAKHGFRVFKKTVKETLLHPDSVYPNAALDQIIASKRIDVRHELRVVYRREGDILTVITFYPARTGRYAYEN